MKGQNEQEMMQVIQELSPRLPRIEEQMTQGRYQEAAWNLCEWFGQVAQVKAQHGEWFANMLHGGEVSDMVFMTDAAAELYCHLRQLPSLPKALGEEMDHRLEALNRKTKLFGDWTVNIYADMLYVYGYQSEDYSDLQQLETWNDWKENH